jgi:hypothetical protein
MATSSQAWATSFANDSGLTHTQGGVIAPGTRVVAYVHASGVQAGYGSQVASRIYTTLNEALGACTANMGDVVVVLPGHTEDISTADQMNNLVAGTRILGAGHGTLRPTFTWTAAAATFLFDVANVSLENCVLKLADAGNSGVTVAAPITVSAAGCAIRNCAIRFGDDADDIVTIGITLSGADDFVFAGNHCIGATAAECTTFLRVTNSDRVMLSDCFVQGGTSSTTVGVVQFLTTASTEFYAENCTFVNLKASSVHAFTGMAGAIGSLVRCNFGILDNLTTAGAETEGNLQFFGCQVVNLAGEGSTAKTPISA